MAITDRPISTPAIEKLFADLDAQLGAPRSIEEDWPTVEPTPQVVKVPLTLTQQLEIAESELRKAGGWRKLPWGDYAAGNRKVEAVVELRRLVAAERDRQLDRAMDDLGPDYPNGDDD